MKKQWISFLLTLHSFSTNLDESFCIVLTLECEDNHRILSYEKRMDELSVNLTQLLHRAGGIMLLLY
jgi:hypothetical protein